MNALNQNIDGKTVIARGRRFKVSGGFGAYAFTMGSAVFGTWEDTNKQDRIDGDEVQNLAEPEDENKNSQMVC